MKYRLHRTPRHTFKQQETQKISLFSRVNNATGKPVGAKTSREEEKEEKGVRWGTVIKTCVTGGERNRSVRPSNERRIVCCKFDGCWPG